MREQEEKERYEATQQLVQSLLGLRPTVEKGQCIPEAVSALLRCVAGLTDVLNQQNEMIRDLLDRTLDLRHEDEVREFESRLTKNLLSLTLVHGLKLPKEQFSAMGNDAAEMVQKDEDMIQLVDGMRVAKEAKDVVDEALKRAAGNE